MLGRNPASRNTMILALSACAETGVRTRARRFLSGLSSDELQFLAEFVGACILESSGDATSAIATLQWRHCQGAEPDLLRHDREHKMLVLREFLDRSRYALPLSRDTGPAAA
ncbi:MAG TPA: hypothetical protein VNV86_21135 [Candidatus Acidoferrum sp.]|jgi:hypothetical protein|nr:hypothetical protein [Candidatus Acidoferrum sp.]